MNLVPYTLDQIENSDAPIGLIVLSTDETIESEMHRYFANRTSPIFVSRVQSGENVTTDSLGAMQANLPAAAELLPKSQRYAVVGYGCTSASSLIGSRQVEELVKSGCDTAHVTNPLDAAAICARHLGVARFALLSPYIEEVNEPLRAAFAAKGLSTDVFGSFGESEEAKVVRISKGSIVEAAVALGQEPSTEAVFLSCTNLRTFDAIPEIEARIGKPVLSSNQALSWHMKRLCKY